jgi:dihydroorotase
MDQFIQKPKKRKRGNLDPWGNPYKTDNLAFAKTRRPQTFSSRNSKNNSRVENNKKKEKLSKSDMKVREKMLVKNVQIKQKSVNESRPFISHNTQNLYKLPSEKKWRAKLLDDIGTGD